MSRQRDEKTAVYPRPASAEERNALERDVKNAEGHQTIDDGFNWLDTNDAEPILDPELRQQFVEQIQAMKTGSPFLKLMVLRFDATVRHLLTNAPTPVVYDECRRCGDATCRGVKLNRDGVCSMCAASPTGPTE